jgi:outer membrane protein assembly factor BamB
MRGRRGTLALGRMNRRLSLFVLLSVLIAASSALGDEPDHLLWKFQSLSWYNRFSTNSTVGPVVLGASAIFGGTYSYQNTTESKLAMVDLASGQARWRFERVGPIGPMAVNGSVIALGNGDAALLLDLATGRLRWEVKGSAQTLVIAGEVVLATESGSLLARELGTGKERWQVKSSSEPVVAGDTAYLLDGRRLRAVTVSAGVEAWNLDLPAGLSYPHTLRGEHLYLLGSRTLGSINVRTRSVEWTLPLESALEAPLTVTDDVLYVTTQDSTRGAYWLRAVEVATQRDRWRASLSSRAPMAPAVLPSLVLAGASAEKESLIAFNRATGAPVWKARVGTVSVQPVLKAETLYVAGQGPKRLYALGAATGAPLWSVMLNGWPLGAVLTGDGKLLVSTDDLTLYAFRTE